MQLENKNAVIYGAGGAIGRALAVAFAKEGAKVFITGRNRQTLDETAELVIGAGGSAEIELVNALDEKQISEHFALVNQKAGSVDISVNATGLSQVDLHGTALIDLSAEQLLHPIDTYVKSNFLTAKVAGKYMSDQKHGVIMMLTAPPGKLAVTMYGGMPAAWSAMESLTRTFAAELGSSNVRVVSIRANGMPETKTINDVITLHAQGIMPREQYKKNMENTTLLKKLPTLDQVAKTAVFLASDGAGAITGTSLNLSGGALAD